MEKKIKLIRRGNTKLGMIPNTSTVPIRDCVNCESCKGKCYAMKSFRIYPNVRKCWEYAGDLARNDPQAWKAQMVEELSAMRCSTKYFRYNVAGDVVSKDHFNAICEIAETFKDIRFLLFTKAFQFVNKRKIPGNLTVIASVFPGTYLPAKIRNLPRAYAGACKGKRFKDAIECPGLCESCGACWDIRKVGRDVKFDIH